jgi:hypothetical protein
MKLLGIARQPGEARARFLAYTETFSAKTETFSAKNKKFLANFSEF